LMDQKVSMWTPLFGITFFGVAGLLHNPMFLTVFLLWVSVTRTVHSVLMGVVARRWHPAFPVLLYYGQVVGAAIKIYVSHNPNVQKWTRQNTGGDAKAMPRADSRMLMLGSLVGFAALVVVVSGVTMETNRFDLSADTIVAELIHGR
jgi:mannuronan synthase